ncbi:hypothetical protein [Aliarcobacter butzleri]|uniref:hypothetical protein n=1 Tax=Aliarcobacter butzleri TaxID=28197 RepID=UPI002B24F549|nr:hypothetical protein [Aliarcobacter butzleri]
MKKIVILILVFLSVNLFADQYVNGHYRSDGSYVNGYYRSSPDSTKSNNFSTYGNTNPYTGEAGTKKYNDYNNYGYSNSNKNSNYGSGFNNYGK